MSGQQERQVADESSVMRTICRSAAVDHGCQSGHGAIVAGARGARATLDHPRLSDAMEVLVCHARMTGCWATGRDMGARWVEVHQRPVPAEVSGRWTRIFERAIADGRVRLRMSGRTKTYAPREFASLLADHGGSDLMRVERAIARLAGRLGGAVPVEAIEAEIASDPALAMRSTATPLSTRVIRLAEQRRIHRVRAPGSTSQRWYYAPLGAKARIAEEAELELDRRMRAIRALWRLAEGRPFTTRVVARYAAARDTFVIQDDTVYGWTNALQHLARQGFLIRLNAGQSDWHVRWALSAEWAALSAEEQAVRLADPYGRDLSSPTPPRAPEVIGMGLGPSGVMISQETQMVAAALVAVHLAPALPGVRVDVGGVSRARDVASLVAHAQYRGARQLAREGRVMEPNARPVTLDEIERVSAQRPLLLPKGTSLIAAVHEATRVRRGMKQAAVAHVGTVRNVAYFSIRASRQASAFVEVQAVMAEANVDRLQRIAGNLQGDWDYSAGGIVPVPGTLLYARAAILHAEAGELAERLDSAMPDAPLSLEERAACEQCLHGVREIAAHAESIKTSHRVHAERVGDVACAYRPPRSVWLDIEVAERQLRGLRDYAMESPRALWARFTNAVRVFRRDVDDVMLGRPGAEADARLGAAELAQPEEPEARERRGRRAVNYLDRVGFGMWVARRDGGPLLAGMAAQAASVIGEWRRVGLIVEALTDAACLPSHAGVCAALGFFDDVEARDALARYLMSVILEAPTPAQWTDAEASADDDGSRTVGRVPQPPPGAHLPRTNSNAVSTAVLALCRTPCGGLATALRPNERHALEVVRDQFSTSFAGRAASQVLRGWDDAWTREQWLAL